MRLFVMFDLPVKTKKDKRNYHRFFRYLEREGYDRLQYSIYARLCNGADAAAKHEARLRRSLPPAGSVRSMLVTEKQFAEMQVLVGDKTKMERKGYADQLLLF